MLGDLSAKYESNGNPATISSGYGDLGGQSYGCYQFAISAGVPQAFVKWLCNYDEPYANYGRVLSQYQCGSEEFNQKWQEIGTIDPGGFKKLQHEYVKSVYYDAAIENLQAIGFNPLERSAALQDVIWSRAVQYSAHWVPSLFRESCDFAGQTLDTISDYNLIYYIYEYLITEADNARFNGSYYHSPNDWVNGSADVVAGLRNRFFNERDEALAML